MTAAGSATDDQHSQTETQTIGSSSMAKKQASSNKTRGTSWHPCEIYPRWTVPGSKLGQHQPTWLGTLLEPGWLPGFQHHEHG